MRLEPGRIVLAEDLTGKGHITRTLGKEDWAFLLVPLDGIAAAVALRFWIDSQCPAIRS
jgi:hypothetical protein